MNLSNAPSVILKTSLEPPLNFSRSVDWQPLSNQPYSPPTTSKETENLRTILGNHPAIVRPPHQYTKTENTRLSNSPPSLADVKITTLNWPRDRLTWMKMTANWLSDWDPWKMAPQYPLNSLQFYDGAVFVYPYIRKFAPLPLTQKPRNTRSPTFLDILARSANCRKI